NAATRDFPYLYGAILGILRGIALDFCPCLLTRAECLGLHLALNANLEFDFILPILRLKGGSGLPCLPHPGHDMTAVQVTIFGDAEAMLGCERLKLGAFLFGVHSLFSLASSMASAM